MSKKRVTLHYLLNYIIIVAIITIVGYIVHLLGFRRSFIINISVPFKDAFFNIYVHNIILSIVMYIGIYVGKYWAKVILGFNAVILGAQLGMATNLYILSPILIYGWLEFGVFIYIVTMIELNKKPRISIVFLLLLISALVETIIGKGGIY